MRRYLAALVGAMLALSVVVMPHTAFAATTRTVISQVPAAPVEGQSVRVWMSSDTAMGETAALEYEVGGAYTKVYGTWNDTTVAGANWYADIPSQPAGSTVKYQLFTRNQSGEPYGYTGFNWSYTVGAAKSVAWNELGHNPFEAGYRSPFGAVPTGSAVELAFRTKPLNADAVDLVIYTFDSATQSTLPVAVRPMAYAEDRVENGSTYAFWTTTLTVPTVPSILYYKFKVTAGTDVDWYSDTYADDHDNLNQGGWGQAFEDEPPTAYQLTVYKQDYATPSWLQNANVYQIFPDRFRNADPTNDYCVDGSTTGCPTQFGQADIIAHTTWNEAIYDPRQPGQYFNAYGNQYYGGDLDGITAKLDYIKGLGFDTLYLTPIFTASSNHRYDTSDYLTVDPALGGNAAYDRLVAALDARGMHLILDGVFNHTSSDSVYFDRYHRWSTDGACESLSSAFRPWYEWNDSTIPCTAASYNGWFGYDSLAVLKDDSPQVRDYIFRSNDSVVNTWYTRGTSGWRFDVADEITHDWWKDFRPYAKADKASGPLVGEVWPDASKYVLGDQLDSVMNYRFRKNILGFARGVGFKDNDNNGSNEIVGLTPSEFDRSLASVREDYPEMANKAMFNLVDSHDTNRALYVLTLQGDNGLTEAKQRQKLTSLFQFSYIGAPTVFYGDEAALNSPSLANGTNGPEDDPYNRATYPWADASGDVNVYGPADQDMIAWYTKFANLRAMHPALRSGEYSTLLTGDTTASATDNNTFAFGRTDGFETAVVVLNNGSSTNTASVPIRLADGTVMVNAVTGAEVTVTNGILPVTLAARSGTVFTMKVIPTDVQAPVVSITSTPSAPSASGWFTKDVTVTARATDNRVVASVKLAVDGAATVSSGALALSSVTAEGTHLVKAAAKDPSGNVGNATPLKVRIDKKAPVTTATQVVNLQARTATVTLSAMDATSGVASMKYAVDAGALQPYTRPFVVSGAGSHTVTYASTDKAGNVEATKTLAVTIAEATPKAALVPTACIAQVNKVQVGVFGYTNSGTTPVVVPVGPKNSFNRPVIGVQPTIFQPGTVTKAFISPVVPSGSTWKLTGPDGIMRSVTVRPDTPRC